MNALAIIRALRAQGGVRLGDLPNSSGVYALRNHTGDIRYIGIAHSEGFRVRIRNKHATGSEDRSHKFSAAYNSGRLWRDRHAGASDDARVAKRLRNAFILKYCSASYVEIADYDKKANLLAIEEAVIGNASSQEVAWNGAFTSVQEPASLVDALITELGMSAEDRGALDRQGARYRESQ